MLVRISTFRFFPGAAHLIAGHLFAFADGLVVGWLSKIVKCEEF